MDFLSAERKAALLVRWEDSVREEPELAHRFGVPNWLVIERARKGEGHEAAAARILAEYFPVVTPTVTVPSVTKKSGHAVVTAEPVTEDVVTEKKVCEDCGKSILSRKVCGACRMARMRAKRA